MIPALLFAAGTYLFYLGMCKWTALPTSAERRWWMLLWGNLLRLGAVGCLVGVVYFLGKAIAGCG